jgi:3D (Asp-Asp-Asp) domain-containing protein/peptidoglycan hydrolase CwlO-like protein
VLAHWKAASTFGLAVAALALLVVPGTGRADDPATLRAHGAQLAAAEQSAQLELFALERRLDTARASLAGVERRLGAVERERATSRMQLRAAKRTLTGAERRLADEVRALYVEERPDVLAVFLGAASIEDALDDVDNLQRTADATNGVLEQAKAARRKVARLLTSLTARRAELRTLRSAATAQARELEHAEAGRVAYIEDLRARQVLNQHQIAQAVATAAAASSAASIETAKAEVAPSISSIGAEALLPPPPPSPQPSPAPQAPVTKSGRRLTVVATAYTIRGTTATGIPTGPGVVAVDPSVIPLGTRMTIPGYGEGVAADTGGGIKGLRIDVWVPTQAAAAQWNWQTVTITLH